jgi:YVTN family beta-propeller protein
MQAKLSTIAKTSLGSITLSLLFWLCPVHAAEKSNAESDKSAFKVSARFALGGDGGWDYIAYDTKGDRLFVSRATRVMVVDAAKGSLIAEIPDTPGVHGIAFNYELGKGYISNGRENTVTVFDLKTLKQISKIKVTGENPDAILYDSFSKRVFTFNGRSKNATAIDCAKDEVAGTIALGGKPEFAVSDGKGTIFVNIEDKSQLCTIDPQKMAVVHTWSLAPGEEPSGLAFDAKNHRLFSVCDNKLMIVMDSETGKVLDKLPIGEGVDGAAFDPEENLAFSSNGGSGTVTVVHEESADSFKVVQTVRTEKSARTITVNPTNHALFLPAAEFEESEPPADGARHRRKVKPGTFTILELSAEH